MKNQRLSFALLFLCFVSFYLLYVIERDHYMIRTGHQEQVVFTNSKFIQELGFVLSEGKVKPDHMITKTK